MGRKIHCLARLACLVAVVWLGGQGLPAANYYVSPDGNDSNPGNSSERPVKYIQSAIKLSAAGDTIYLLPGTHTVRPGDKNITFDGLSGKPGAPITVTTTGPGVIIDLKAAVIGWGGFRISDGSQWIVIDGGGAPNIFDESTYHLVIQNAAFEAKTGDDRSNTNCRPVTIQSASNIVLRNIFGKRSMGTFGVFGAVKNVLIENCRCVPGDKAGDLSVSHGIYVGTGADDVLIRHCFIKWGGGGRLGLQNNGGGKNVVIEDSFITECAQAIKAFNGGHVTAKNCHFYAVVDDKTMQGEVDAVNVVTTPPTPEELAAAAKYSATGTFPAAGGSAKKPATDPAPHVVVEAAPPKPPSPERLEEIAARRATAIAQIVKLLVGVKGIIVVLPFKGQFQEMELASASVTDGIAAKMNGGKLSLAWDTLSASHLAGVLELLVTEKTEGPGPVYLSMAILYTIDGANVQAAAMTTKALEADPALESEMKAALARLR